MTFSPKMVTLAREAAGLTQHSLAHEAGVSQAFISKIEHGLEIPNDSVLERMSMACDVPIQFFRQDEEIIGESLVDFFHKKRLTLPAKPLRKANAYRQCQPHKKLCACFGPSNFLTRALSLHSLLTTIRLKRRRKQSGLRGVCHPARYLTWWHLLRLRRLLFSPLISGMRNFPQFLCQGLRAVTSSF